jgi:hypothetical protein
LATAAPGPSEKEVFKMYSGGLVSSDFVWRYLRSGGRPDLARAVRSMRMWMAGALVSLVLMADYVSIYISMFMDGVIRLSNPLPFWMATLVTVAVILGLSYAILCCLRERRILLQQIRDELARDVMET